MADDTGQTISSNQNGINPLLIVVVVFAIFIAGSAAYLGFTGGFGNLPGFARPKATPSPTPQAEVLTSVDTIRSPVKLDNPAIISTKIVYNFDTTVKELTSDDRGSILITPLNGIKGDGIPEKFRLSPETIFYFTDGKNRTPATFSDLAVGKQIHVIASYDIKTKKWKTARVGIVIKQ